MRFVNLGNRLVAGILSGAQVKYAKEMRNRYRKVRRAERGPLLDEFTAVTGYHRKYAIVLLGREPTPRSRPSGKPTRFTDEVGDALLKIWRAADYPWSVRLVAMLPTWMPHARVHLDLSGEVERLLLTMSARSMDRLLRRHRTELKRRIYGRTKPGTLLKHHVPVRTERWDTTEVGWCETDTVAHCGEIGDGEFAFSVNMTDVASTWTETRAVLGKGQRFVVDALEEMRCTLPLRCVGLTPTAVRSSSITIATAGAKSISWNSHVGVRIAKTITPTSSKRTGRTCERSSVGSVSMRPPPSKS